MGNYKTKFNVGQEVFFMAHNEIRNAEITGLQIYDKQPKIDPCNKTTYFINNNSFDENQLFLKKEDIIAYLLQDKDSPI